MRSHYFLQLTPDELDQLKVLTQAHRTPQALARRAQLIQLSHAHPDWSTKKLAHILERHDPRVAQRGAMIRYLSGCGW